jgi:hypothetical protein
MVDWYFVGLVVYVIFLDIRIGITRVRLENRIEIMSRRLLG